MSTLPNFSFTRNQTIFSQEPLSLINDSKKKDHKKKKVPNPYFIFCSKQRLIFQEQHPEMSSRDITKLLASKWKEMTPEEKTIYQEQYSKSLPIFHPASKDLKSKKEIILHLTTETGEKIYLPAYKDSSDD